MLQSPRVSSVERRAASGELRFACALINSPAIGFRKNGSCELPKKKGDWNEGGKLCRKEATSSREYVVCTITSEGQIPRLTQTVKAKRVILRYNLFWNATLWIRLGPDMQFAIMQPQFARSLCKHIAPKFRFLPQTIRARVWMYNQVGKKIQAPSLFTVWTYLPFRGRMGDAALRRV